MLYCCWKMMARIQIPVLGILAFARFGMICISTFFRVPAAQRPATAGRLLSPRGQRSYIVTTMKTVSHGACSRYRSTSLRIMMLVAYFGLAGGPCLGLGRAEQPGTSVALPETDAKTSLDQAEKARGRESLDFDGVMVRFPAGQANLALALKPSILTFRDQRRKEVLPEIDALVESFQDEEGREFLGWMLGMDLPSSYRATPEAGEKMIDDSLAELSEYFQPVRDWVGDVAAVHLWTRDELKQFEQKPGEFAFPQSVYQFPTRGPVTAPPSIVVEMPLRAGGYGAQGLPMVVSSEGGMRIDLPLLQPVGLPTPLAMEGPVKLLDALAEASLEPLAELELLAHTYLYGRTLSKALSAGVFADNAQHSILPSTVAHYYVAINFSGLDGEEPVDLDDDPEAMSAAAIEDLESPYFDFSIAEQLIAELPDLDPLNPPQGDSPVAAAQRELSRSIVAIALITSLQLEGEDIRLFEFFEERGIEVPDGRFTHDAFVDLLESTLRIPGGFKKEVENIKQEFLSDITKKTDDARERASER